MALNTNLESVWKMDEASGSRSDSVGSNTLSDNNSVGSASPKLGTHSAQFVNASSQYLSHADNSSLSPGDIDFAFCAWVYLDSLTSDRDILSHWDDNVGSQASYLLRVTGSKFQWLISQDGSAADSVTANTFGTLSTGTWYFVFVYHDSVNNLIGIQVNNGTADTTAHSTGVFDSTAAFFIGAHNPNSPTAYMDGRIDNVYYWRGYIPTTTERGYLYNSGSGLDYPLSSPSLSPSASQSPSASTSASASASISPSSSVSASASASKSPSASQSPSASGSASQSPSASISPSASASASASASGSASLSPSSSSSASQSPSASGSASLSPSASQSPSASISPSRSASASASASPSPGFSDYTREEILNLPTNTNDLSTVYTAQEIIDVSSLDGIYVGQVGTLDYMIHQFKIYIATSVDDPTILCKGYSLLDASLSTIYLQIFNQISNLWETLDSDNHTKAGHSFRLAGDINNFTNYRDINKVVTCRVYQLAI